MTVTQIRGRYTGRLWDAVAANVRAEAARRGHNRADLARLLGLNRVGVADRWRGTTQWQLVELERLGELFGVDPAEFLRTRRDSNSQPSDWESPDVAQVIALDMWRADREAVAS